MSNEIIVTTHILVSEQSDSAEPLEFSTAVDEGGRVSLIEVIAYTAVLGFIALLASGLFDGMVAWQ